MFIFHNVATEDMPQLFQAEGRLEDLTTEEMAKVCQTHPRWMFEYRPHFVACHNPSWITYFAPEWCMVHQPSLMLLHRKDWVAANKPEVLFALDLDYLMDKNPIWAINNHPELVSVLYPEVLGKYTHDTLYRYRADLSPVLQKKKKWWHKYRHALRVVFPFWVHRYDALKNPKLPQEIIDTLK